MSVCQGFLLEEARDFLTSTEKLSNDCHDIVSQVSLNIDTLRIPYAYKITATMPESGNVLFKIRLLLGISWDEILGRDVARLTKHRPPPTYILDEALLATLDTSSVLAELAKGSWCRMDGLINGQIDWLAFR
jgi:hypothetical protein